MWPFGSRRRRAAEALARQQQSEFSDPYHHRASVSDDDAVMVDPGKVRANVAMAIERLDLDIDTAISIQDDVASFDELAVLVNMGLGVVLITDVVNTAMRVMLARYPEELVRRPLPPEFDVRKLYPLTFDDDEHERARVIVNRRGELDRDLDPFDDLTDELGGLDEAGTVQVFMAAFVMCGSRLSALKSRTGIE